MEPKPIEQRPSSPCAVCANLNLEYCHGCDAWRDWFRKCWRSIQLSAGIKIKEIEK